MKQKRSLLRWFTIALWVASAWAQSGAPVPLLKNGQAVDWWFVFKFNTATFNECGGAQRACLFGGDVQTYKSGFGQQFAVASSANGKLTQWDRLRRRHDQRSDRRHVQSGVPGQLLLRALERSI